MQKTEAAAAQSPKFQSTLNALVAHPTRVKAYCILAERTTSPVEIAAQIGKPVGHVGYHVRKLHQFGLIELVEERPIRGAVEHFYRAITRPFQSQEDMETANDEDNEFLAKQTIQLHMADISRSVDSGVINRRPDRWLLRLPFDDMDAEGFDEMNKLFEGVYEEMLLIGGRAAMRKELDADHESFPAAASAMFFELPKGDLRPE
jgi:DNA-binding transcriptional ArsR family regulator